jgi:hypothetical protein
MAVPQFIIPSIQPQENAALASAREHVAERLAIAIRTLQVAAFSLGATGDVSDDDIFRSCESLAFAIDHYHEELELATLEAEADSTFPPFAGGAGQEGVRQ